MRLAKSFLLDLHARVLRSPRCFAIAMLIGVGLTFHLPWIDRPFGGSEPNPGIYFGTYVRNYETLGLSETRGLWIGRCVLDDISEAAVNRHHPPGVAWLFYLFGPAEWQIRLATILGSIAAAALLYLFLLVRFGHWPSLFGASVMMLSPNVALYSQGSFEDVLIPTGLALLLALRMLGSASSFALRAVVVVAALVGPWFDWEFAFFCLACVPICWSGTVRRTIRRLALPAAVSVGSIVSILVWRMWASAAPGLPTLAEANTVGDLLTRYVFDRPPFMESMVAKASAATESLSPTLVVLMLLGLLPLLRRDPRLAIALILVAVLPIVAFASHIDWVFYTFFVPVAAASGTALLAVAKWVPTRLRVVFGFAVVAAVAVAAWNATAASATTLFRDAGRIMNAATRPDVAWGTGPGGAGGQIGDAPYSVGSVEAVNAASAASAANPGDAGDTSPPSYLVAHCLGQYAYGYYIESMKVIQHSVADPDLLKQGIASSGDLGVRYLWTRGASQPTSPGLAEFLRPFPKRRIPELEVRFKSFGVEFEIDEAWLVTLKEPR